jgi:hypothetical protein
MIQPQEIEKYLNNKNKRILDKVGWTGEYHVSAKDIIDMMRDISNNNDAEEIDSIVDDTRMWGRVHSLLRSGKRLAAIKLFHNAKKDIMTIKEAKEVVDAIWEREYK